MKNENINKENFFNDLMEKYPDATQQFCDWIDRYKKEVHMDDWQKPHFKELKSIKFHDLPIEMQKGIIHRFVKEKFGTDMINFTTEGLKNDFTRLMEQLQLHILERKNHG